MSEKSHNNYDNPLTSRRTDGGKNEKQIRFVEKQIMVAKETPTSST